jgi:serine/threonine-protein kinase RsbW
MEVVLHLPVVPNAELVAAKAVETLGRALGMHQTQVEAASVAMVEACLNAMEHGGGPVTVRLRSDNHSRPCLVIEVEDHGRGFDPERAPRNSSSRVLGSTSKRGWGLTLIRELMDEVQIQSAPGRTVVAMRKYVESAP